MSQAISLEIRLLSMMLICQGRMGDAAGAADTVQQTLNLIHAVPEPDAARALSNLAVYYGESGDLARGTELHREQVAIYQRLNNRSGQANTLINLGYQYLCLGLYAEARSATEEALGLLEKFGAQREMAYARLNLGLIYWRINQSAAALQILKTTQQTLETLGDRFGQAAALCYLAVVLEELPAITEARHNYEVARQTFLTSGARGNAADALAGLTRCALQEHDLHKVHQYAAELWNYLRLQGTQGMELPLQAYLTCVHAFSALGEEEKAHKAIAAGFEELIGRSEKISRLEWGRSYLSNIPEHRTLIELWEQLTFQV
jgi:tetratricopeptide (TPR) repeat protein